MAHRNLMNALSVVLASVILIGCGRGFESVKVRNNRSASPQVQKTGEQPAPQAPASPSPTSTSAAATAATAAEANSAEPPVPAAGRTEVEVGTAPAQPAPAQPAPPSATDAQSPDQPLEEDVLGATFKGISIYRDPKPTGQLFASILVKIDADYYSMYFEAKNSDLVAGQTVSMKFKPGTLVRIDTKATIVTELPLLISIPPRVKLNVTCDQTCRTVKAEIFAINNGERLSAKAELKLKAGQEVIMVINQERSLETIKASEPTIIQMMRDNIKRQGTRIINAQPGLASPGSRFDLFRDPFSR